MGSAKPRGLTSVVSGSCTPRTVHNANRDLVVQKTYGKHRSDLVSADHRDSGKEQSYRARQNDCATSSGTVLPDLSRECFGEIRRPAPTDGGIDTGDTAESEHLAISSHAGRPVEWASY